MNPAPLLLRVTVLAFACLSYAPKAKAAGADIAPLSRRERSLELATRLAQPAQPGPLPSPLRNPFHPEGFDPSAPLAAPRGGVGGQSSGLGKARTDAELLAYVAEQIAPSGLMVMGGQPILLIGKKKYKTGDRLIIDLEGHDIELEITAIERSTFSLRLNGAEVTRPLNQGKNP